MAWVFDFMFSSTTGFLLSCLIILITWNFWSLLMVKRRTPPGPFPLPLIGAFYVLPLLDLSEIPFKMKEVAKKYDKLFTVIGPNGGYTIFVHDVQVLRDIFTKNTDLAGRPYVERHSFTQSLGNPLFPKQGIVFSDYEEQLKLQRNASMVALRGLGYGKKSIENKIIEEAEYLSRAFKEFHGQSFNAKHLLDNAVSNIICSLLFGDRYEYGDAEFKDLIEILDEIFRFLSTSVMLDTVWFWKYLPTSWGRISEAKQVGNELHDFAVRKINERKEHMEHSDESTDFITAYLREVKKSEGKLEDRSNQLVKDFFGAGSETTATTLGWAIYFMMKYPKIQHKVRKEICDLLGDGAKPLLKDTEKLPFVEATLTEILRVAPTAPGSLPHYAVTDTEICGYKVPKGTTVQGITLRSNWDEKLFPDPQLLKPERHLDENGQFVKNDNLIPFGIGRRSCLGEQLARQELFLFFTHLIQNFEFKVPEGETIPPQKGIWELTYKPPIYNVSAIPMH